MDLIWQMAMLTVRARRPKAVVNVVQGNIVNVVKASAYWIWKPKTKVIDHVSKHNSASIILNKFDYVDAQGRSKSVMGICPNLQIMKKLMDDMLLLEVTPKEGKSLTKDDGFKPLSDDDKKVDEDLGQESECKNQEKHDHVNITNNVNATGTNRVNDVSENISNELPFDLNMPALEYISTFNFSSNHEDDDEQADMNNMDTTIQVSHVPTTRIHKDQEPKKGIHALRDPSWIEAMQEELLQFKLQEVWTLVDLPNGKRAIGTKWVFWNKKDERGIMIINKARLVAQGHTQEERIDYDDVFSPIARIKAIRLFLAYASFKDFVVYQMDVKSAFLYGQIEEEVYVYQPPGFEDPDFPDKVYKELCIAFEKMMHEKFQMSYMGELTFFLGLQVKQKQDGIFIRQDKYVIEILKKYGFTKVKNASTPIETQKPLLKDEDGKELDFHMYRSMIGSLMYLKSSRHDIMLAVYACARYQVNPNISHLYAMKRIFSDYAGASLDRKFTTRGITYYYCSTLMLLVMTYYCQLKVNAARHNLQLLVDFWTTAKARTINGEAQLHAKVDGKTVIISETSIRRDLQFGDEEGVDCLPTATIFEQLSLIWSKSENKGKVPTEMELVLEQTQQGTSHEVLALVMRTASTPMKSCQGDSLEFYLITGNPDGRSYWIKTSQDLKPHAYT
nr:putative ribonuclease H-like domain-containing protein [Tanacetum cinerariifolium]